MGRTHKCDSRYSPQGPNMQIRRRISKTPILASWRHGPLCCCSLMLIACLVLGAALGICYPLTSPHRSHTPRVLSCDYRMLSQSTNCFHLIGIHMSYVTSLILWRLHRLFPFPFFQDLTAIFQEDALIFVCFDVSHARALFFPMHGFAGHPLGSHITSRMQYRHGAISLPRFCFTSACVIVIVGLICPPIALSPSVLLSSNTPIH